MPEMKFSARLTRLFPFLGLIALSACHVDPNTQNPVNLVTSHTFDHANWQQIPGQMGHQVEPITFTHSVNFEAGETELNEAELSRLLAFLQESGVHQGARIEVDGPRSQGGYFDPVTAARVSGIEAELSGIGLRSQIPTRPITSLLRPGDTIAVSVTRAMVILPDCSTPQPEFAMRPTYTYSCSNTAALDMMIADPLDLERGRDEGPADGETAAKVIDMYRRHKPSGWIELQ
jgi:pilus biogenesis lipoprotein CpaD